MTLIGPGTDGGTGAGSADPGPLLTVRSLVIVASATTTAVLTGVTAGYLAWLSGSYLAGVREGLIAAGLTGVTSAVGVWFKTLRSLHGVVGTSG